MMREVIPIIRTVLTFENGSLHVTACQATGVSGSGKAHHDFVILVKLYCDCQFW